MPEFGILSPIHLSNHIKTRMKLTTLLNSFLALSLLAGAANAAALSLASGSGFGTNLNAPGTLAYNGDPSGIKISFSGQPHSQFGNAAGTRGWNNDPSTGVLGYSEVKNAGFDHVAIAHFNTFGADQVTIDFNSASGVNLSTVHLIVWDLDTNGGFQETLLVSNNPTQIGAAGGVNGTQTNDLALTIPASKIITLTPNQNPAGSAGLSAFTLTWNPVPEPSTGLLALLGGSVLFLRRRR